MDGIELFNKTCLECSKIITTRYSTSFTLGIRLLAKKYHSSIYAIYGFVRYADEIVDTFLQKDRRALLEGFKNDTYAAIDAGVSFNPVLHAFQQTVNKYNIEKDVIEAFLHSMEMDLDFKKYDDSKYHEYIYGSAEVVGLMCLRVFCEGDDELYQKLKAPACSLGAAFQKVNFLRDMKSDYEDRGRVYFPGIDYNKFDLESKREIEKDIQKDFDDALVGIEQLPEGAQSGVRIAYIYYQKLFNKIKSLPPETVTQKRIRISNWYKFWILITEKFLYMAIILFVLSCTLPLSFERRLHYYTKWHALFPAVAITAIFFIFWDVIFTKLGIWRFSPRHVTGCHLVNLPIEECLFFLVVPYSCVFIYEVTNYFIPDDIFLTIGTKFFYAAIPGLLILAICAGNRCYTRLTSIITVLILLSHYLVFGERLLGRFFIALAFHYIPFFITNGILTGCVKEWGPVVIYNDEENLKFRLHTIPIEDAIYSLALLLMNITLYEYFLGVNASAQ